MYLIENIQSFSTPGALGWVAAAENEGIKKVVRLNHSALAMQAAKAMPASRQKSKTGHIVCLHLLGMLAENSRAVAARGAAGSADTGVSGCAAQTMLPGYSQPGQQLHEKQYALAFHG